MDDITQELSELCFDLGDNLRHEKDEEKKKKLLIMHLENVTSLNKENKFIVPDFLPGLEWINVKEPITFKKHLQGKVVILDFFTYCCINCMHILPDLKKLEQEFPIEDGLVVIGVHSAKFTNERNTKNILSAVKRYEIKHAVVNDNRESMWKALGIHCWPTLYVIGPNGEPLLFLQGEGHYETLRIFISQTLAYFNKSKLISHKKLDQLYSEDENIPLIITSNVLLYPGKVAISKDGLMIAIADSGHHRVIIAVLKSGIILHEIGGPNAGLADGKFTEAKFCSPQGLSFFTNDIVFVADTENHCIRKIDLVGETVMTAVGDGRQGRDYQGGKSNVMQQISSPWDVCIPGDEKGKICFIAMAGTHQIWAYFLDDVNLWKRTHTKGSCSAIVGSGREENRNNHYPMSAGLAQPSGLAFQPLNNDININEGHLYVADSESSTIRQINLNSGRVVGLIGGTIDTRNLFAFGDNDGTGLDVKLQHPLGVAYCPGDKQLYVCDTYNHKIKIVDPEKKTCYTLNLQEWNLNEPGGLCAHGDHIYIADTNNHCIRILNVIDKNISKLELKQNSSNAVDIENYNQEISVKVNSSGGDLHLSLNLTLPAGTTLTEEAPSKWTLMMNGDHRLLNTSKAFSLNPKWNIPVKKDICSKISINGRIFICEKNICTVKELNLLVSLEYTDNGQTSVQTNLKCAL